MITLKIIFWGTAKLFSTVVIPFYISTNSVWSFQFLPLSVLIHYYWSHPLPFFLLFSSLAAMFLIYFLIYFPVHCVFVTFKQNKNAIGGCIGNNVLPPAEIRLWQFFPWKLGFCYREELGYISQWLFSPPLARAKTMYFSDLHCENHMLIFETIKQATEKGSKKKSSI